MVRQPLSVLVLSEDNGADAQAVLVAVVRKMLYLLEPRARTGAGRLRVRP